MDEPPDKRFLIAVLVFGIVAACVSGVWLKDGRISVRHSMSPSGQAPQNHVRVAGDIPRDHMLYYPVTAAWGLLGIVMIVLSALAYLKDDEHLMKLCAYCCVGVLVLGFATLGITRLFGAP